MSKKNKLTVKQKLFVKHYVDNKGNATEAASQAYNVTSRRTAEVVGSENLRKPEIVSALSEYNGLFESVITNTVKDWANEDDTAKRTLATQTAKWGYEQIHGKATQRTESVSASFISHTSDKAKQYNLDV